jgi:hypothetical protein
MAVQTLKVKGREFVLVPKREYERMRAQIERQSEQDRGDVTEAKRRSREPSIPLAEVRKRLGA